MLVTKCVKFFVTWMGLWRLRINEELDHNDMTTLENYQAIRTFIGLFILPHLSTRRVFSSRSLRICPVRQRYNYQELVMTHVIEEKMKTKCDFMTDIKCTFLYVSILL